MKKQFPGHAIVHSGRILKLKSKREPPVAYARRTGWMILQMLENMHGFLTVNPLTLTLSGNSGGEGRERGRFHAMACTCLSARMFPAGVAGLIVFMWLVAGCAPGDKAQTITFWAMGREGETVRRLLAEFEHENPGIRVDLQTLPWTGAHQKLLTAFAGGSTPDVCQLGNTWIAELTTLGALMPLESMIEASGVVKPQDYFPGIWETNRVDGRLYGVPWYVDTRLLFYRRDLLAQAGFDHPPRDWAEWSRQLAAIKAMVGPERYAVLLPLNEFEQLLSLGLQQGEPLLRAGGRYGNFESPGFKKALRFYVDMFRLGWAPLKANTQISNVWAEFGRGFYSFYLSGPWNIAEFKARMPADRQDAWTTAPLPGPDGPGASLAGGSSLVIFEASSHKRAAWQLIEYLSRPDVQHRFYLLVGDMPPRRTTWDNGNLAEDPYARAFREQLERVKPTPNVPEWERIATQLALVGEQLAHGLLTTDQAAQELNRRTDDILAKRRWILDRGGAR
jgi:multiple sugar transport system substrate-binding protein